jgi:hypothetical protein
MKDGISIANCCNSKGKEIQNKFLHRIPPLQKIPPCIDKDRIFELQCLNPTQTIPSLKILPFPSERSPTIPLRWVIKAINLSKVKQEVRSSERRMSDNPHPGEGGDCF